MRHRPIKFIILLSSLLISILVVNEVQNSFGRENAAYSIGAKNPASSNTINGSQLIQILNRTTINHSSEWDSIPYTMLLITPNETAFIALAMEYAIWKTYRGIPALVVANWSLYPGRDDPERIRNAIITYREIYPIQWVLLMGGTTHIPIRTIYNPDGIIVPKASDYGDPYYKPTDLYYANLNGTWNMDNDTNWGELRELNSADSTQDELDWSSEVYVGRFPADTSTELGLMINKTIDYEKGTYAGAWMNKMIAASTILTIPDSLDLDGEDEARVNQYVVDTYIEGKMDWVHILEHTPYFSHPETSDFVTYYQNTIPNLLNQGASILLYGGHGATDYFSSQYYDSVFGNADAKKLKNTNMPVMVYSDACLTNAYDTQGLGKVMLVQNQTGAIGYIGAMRISWFYSNDTDLEWMNRALNKLYFEQMFEKHYYQQGKALYESKNAYLNSQWFQNIWNNPDLYDWWTCEQKSLTTYMLLGDPTVDIYTDIPHSITPLFDSSKKYYEGTQFNFRITDVLNQSIPYAIISFSSNDGKYHTYTADVNGNVIINLPYGARVYNYTIFGHNTIYSQGSFQVFLDDDSPQFLSGPMLNPKAPDTTIAPKIEIGVTDEGSGISDGWVVISSDNFRTHEIYALRPVSNNLTHFLANLPQLDYASYEYAVIVFDYANNMNYTIDSNIQTFEIPIPVEFYLLILGNIVASIGVIMIIKKGWNVWKKFSLEDALQDDFIKASIPIQQ